MPVTPSPLSSSKGGATVHASTFDRLDHASALEIFGTGPHAVPVELQRAPKARVLWINRRAMHDDPQFEACGASEEVYGAHLLNACAFIVPTDSTGQPPADTIAFADRYGGVGIGTNGGSGRAAVVNGYLVKGIGKTPLIGKTANPMHASGGAYLEECVRETIFSEVICAEFPNSAIPTLAIIDTGLVQHWTGDYFGPASERRVLLVRPCMLRPAHFERAPAFHSSNKKEGALDFARVRHVSDEASRLFGTKLINRQLTVFLSSWARQLAYAYIHRLSPSGNSTSNICLDGKLLDFGACSALPSLAQITMVPGSPPTGNEFATLTEAAKSLAYYFGRCIDPSHDRPEIVERMVAEAGAVYQETILLEMLRICGVPKAAARAAIRGADHARLAKAVRVAVSYFREERFDIYSGTPVPRRAWDIADLWKPEPPLHLVPLRDVLADLGMSAQICRDRCILVSRPRAALYREELKSHLHEQLASFELSPRDEPRFISELICKIVALSRRDTKEEALRAIPVGFAAGLGFSLVIYRCEDAGDYFGLAEWANDEYATIFSNSAGKSGNAARIAIEGWTSNSLLLGRSAVGPIQCTVKTISDEQ